MSSSAARHSVTLIGQRACRMALVRISVTSRQAVSASSG